MKRGLIEAWFIAILLCSGVLGFAQRLTGEIRLQVKDATGAAAAASGTIESLSSGVHRNFQTDVQGFHTFGALPFGLYHLEIERSGFAKQAALIEVRSEAPVEQTVTLGLATLETTTEVRASDTLMDQRNTGAMQHVGSERLTYRPTTMPGRSVVDAVNTEPGWVVEANGILHPRGSEYAVQYVIDGVPLYDNRSPAFAQSLGIDDFESMTVRTANFPAEFGRKLGGVIEVNTQRDKRPGLHGSFSIQGGSYDQSSGYGSLQYATGRNSFSASGEGLKTDRYLDPPVIENYTNHASGGGFSARFDRDWSPLDSTRLYTHTRRTGLLVPNEKIQQAAGQRQDRSADETLGQVSHTHLFSSRFLLQARAMVRDTSANLWSNPLSTPIQPTQDRGFREGYFGGSVSVSIGQHELKAGADALITRIHEAFSYHIASYELDGVPIFEANLPQDFQFKQRANGHDQSAFVQDQWHLGRLTLSAGLRFDHYRLIANETAWSPRLGAAYYISPAGLLLRASYDRVFQAPAVENVLLASTDLVSSLGGAGAFLPLKPARGNYFEAGLSKTVFGRLRLDGTWYRRRVANFADDTLLLNTGVSFPIAFREAEIHGYEAKLEIPRWSLFSGFLSYSNMTGTGRLPVAGGLFLGDAADEALSGTGSFPITQDQRNTVRSRVRVQLHRRVWFAFAATYNSGLPVEIDGPSNLDFITKQYGPEISSKVNFERGRVRPSGSLDSSIGVELFHSDRYTLRLQGDVVNLSDRLNVINFAGLLSGTALEAGRNFAIRLNATF